MGSILVRKTVDKVLRPEAAVPVRRRIRKHKLDAFRRPLEQQLKAGSVTCDQLLSCSRSLGFDGSKRMLQRFVREFRETAHCRRSVWFLTADGEPPLDAPAHAGRY